MDNSDLSSFLCNEFATKTLDSFISGSKIYRKHKQHESLNRATVPRTSRVYNTLKPLSHSRLNMKFDRFYNTSPRRAVKMLKNARLHPKLPVPQPPRRLNTDRPSASASRRIRTD